MPELPEVQTIISDLNQKIKGETIVGFWSDWGRAIKNKALKDFTKEIAGRKILGARRIGKNIFLDLSGKKTLYIHLKMTGHLLVKPATSPPAPLLIKERGVARDYFNERVNQYIHHVWKLKSGRTLEFSDLRKFGKIVLEDTEKIGNLKEIRALGVDAMDVKFTFKKFQEILAKKSNAKIGLVLMEQSLIAGIGNIYRSEILFESGVLPEREVLRLSEKEKRTIFSNIKKVLKRAIRLRGTSDSDYRDTSGAPGGFQKVMKVYNREKQACQKCGTIIVRRTLGQRSVFVCPKCQK